MRPHGARRGGTRRPHGQDRALASFELIISPDVAVIATVRRFVGELCARVIDDDGEVTSRVIVATHELLDNAIRHAKKHDDLLSTAESRIRVTVSRVREQADVVIDTTNAIDDARERDLRQRLEEMKTREPAEHYASLLQRAARREDGSGLGLGRVQAESAMIVSGRFEDGVAYVSAEGRFFLDSPKGEPST